MNFSKLNNILLCLLNNRIVMMVWNLRHIVFPVIYSELCCSLRRLIVTVIRFFILMTYHRMTKVATY